MAEMTWEPSLLGLRCAGCGYGASCETTPERCPMCGGETWEDEVQQPSAGLDWPLL